MAVSSLTSKFALERGLNARPAGGVQQSCAVSAVRVSGNSKDWSNGSLRVTSARVLKSSAIAAVKTGVAVDANAPPSVLVERLLALVENTDRGAQIGDAETLAIVDITAKLESLCIPEPLSSPLLFGDWDVVYSSNPTAPGGYYRSILGRALLKTREMVQSVQAPDVVTNKVVFAALGFLNGQTSMVLYVTPLLTVTSARKLTPLDRKWVDVVFESPQVQLGPLRMQYGGVSGVKLAIVYLDEVVRIGRGSRGTLLVFRRRI